MHQTQRAPGHNFFSQIIAVLTECSFKSNDNNIVPIKNKKCGKAQRGKGIIDTIANRVLSNKHNVSLQVKSIKYSTYQMVLSTARDFPDQEPMYPLESKEVINHYHMLIRWQKCRGQVYVPSVSHDFL